MVVLFVWIGAVVFAAVVVGFCAYELSWKGKRLSGDLTKLQSLAGELETLQGDVAAIQSRIAETRP